MSRAELGKGFAIGSGKGTALQRVQRCKGYGAAKGGYIYVYVIWVNIRLMREEVVSAAFVMCNHPDEKIVSMSSVTKRHTKGEKLGEIPRRLVGNTVGTVIRTKQRMLCHVWLDQMAWPLVRPGGDWLQSRQGSCGGDPSRKPLLGFAPYKIDV